MTITIWYACTQGCVVMGEDDWEVARVMEGRPAQGAELAAGASPLEVGLCHAVSLEKVGRVGLGTAQPLKPPDTMAHCVQRRC